MPNPLALSRFSLTPLQKSAGGKSSRLCQVPVMSHVPPRSITASSVSKTSARASRRRLIGTSKSTLLLQLYQTSEK
eukprot:2894360-Amphidinium_carterae.1